MIKKILAAFIFLFQILFFATPSFAKENSFVSIVNPVRGQDFWEEKNQPVEKAVLSQIEILKEDHLPATFLLRFDVLSEQKIIEALKGENYETGLFLEITPSWAKIAGISYHQTESWHDAGSAFLSGYEREERVKLIDSAFDEYKKVFGTFPKSVGAWWIDGYSLGYMQNKYNIIASLIVADQYTTDNYQIWGQYWSAPYYPAKNNALHPAQSVENKLPVVMMQWASRDPVNGYGKGVEESTFSVQANDYTNYQNLDSGYFASLVDIYTKQGLNQFSHLVVGLENSYSWDKYRREYQNQINILAEKKDRGKLSIVTMEDFARWYKSNFPALSPSHIIVADDPLGTSGKAVWFMNLYFRAGWFYNQEESVFRDIRQYVEGEEELCFLKRCDQVNFATFATRVLDDVSFGHKWIIDEGKLTDFNIKKRGDNFVITYTNEAGTERSLEFLPRDIAVDGKISSIDGVILEATKHQLERQKQIFLEKGSFSWSFLEVFLKTLKFLIFIILGSLVPGFLLINKILPKETPKLQKIILAQILGLVIVTLLFYTLSIFKARQMIFLYPLINLLFLVKLRKQIVRNFSLKISDRFNFLIIGLTFAGVIFQQLPTFKNGLHFPYGLGFWGPNTHDGVWHISLINQLLRQVPPPNPVFAGETLKNYHYFYDLLVAVTNYLSGIPVGDLLFRFYPVTFSVILGIATYYLAKHLFRLKKDLQSELGILLILYLTYFAGSFGWIVEYIKMRHLGGESAFWANQSISFNLNPPFAISLLIVISILQLLFLVKFNKLSIVVLTILMGSLISFKAYGGILILLSLFLFSIFKKSFPHLLLFLTSASLSFILFLSNFSLGKQLIIFSPFWFIHSMIDSPDRVGWARLSLARVAGWEGGNWFKFLTVEAISFWIFLIGNLGTRAFALLALLKTAYIVRREDCLFIFIFSTLSFFIPTLFIQEGNPWNTIQFLYYFIYLSAIVGGYIFAKIIVKMPKVFALPVIAVFILVTPINSWATANGYLPYQPHAFISNQELEALEFLRSQKMGIVLAFPYDAKLKQRIAEPWPILVYDSTAYVSAFSGKSLFLEDEGQNQILLTDYKKRKVLSKDFFARPTREFLKDHNIRYVYLPKLSGVSLDFDSFLKQIYQNEEVYIYEVE